MTNHERVTEGSFTVFFEISRISRKEKYVLIRDHMLYFLYYTGFYFDLTETHFSNRLQ